jgi:molecular chaperone GrpE
VPSKNTQKKEKEKQRQDAPQNEEQKAEKMTREEELENQLKQALADYQNLKRDMQKRLDFEEELIRADMLKSIIELADDIDVAVDHVEDEKGWREGVTMILEKFRKVIENVGAEIIETKQGDAFDADIHEAVGVVYEGEDGTIACVVQNGYRLGNIVVRPARVIVTKMNNKKS